MNPNVPPVLGTRASPLADDGLAPLRRIRCPPPVACNAFQLTPKTATAEG